MKILVTGGAGFIGSHTVDLLLTAGHKVTVFDNLASGKLKNLKALHPDFTFIQGDILDYKMLLSAINKADAVLHLAALAAVTKSIEDPINSLQVNTKGFVHVLQAIRELNRSIRLVYASSAAVYGNVTQLPCSDEKKLEAPVLSPYALEKINCERYADLYEKLFGIKSLGLRYFNVYGPRQDPESPYSGVIAKFIEKFKRDETITVFGDGSQSRDFIYVEDVAKANLLALESDATGVLNIATGVPQSLRNLIECLETVGNKSAKTEYSTVRAGDIPHSYASTAKASEALNFQASSSLSDGLRLLISQV